MRPAVAVLYGDAGAAALVDALRAWRADYASSYGYESLIAMCIRHIKVQTSIYPSGRSTVHVRVEGRPGFKDDDYWYEAHLKGGSIQLVSILEDEPREV